MNGSFRQSMAWLHTWVGLLLGWLLVAIFITGTSAYFRQEITLWMEPETHDSTLTPNTLDMAVAVLNDKASDARSWDISLPSARHTVEQRSLGVFCCGGRRQRGRKARPGCWESV